jgi:hypothetical protein
MKEWLDVGSSLAALIAGVVGIVSLIRAISASSEQTRIRHYACAAAWFAYAAWSAAT